MRCPAPNTMVITRRMAEKYFPGENPVGKTMILNEDKDKPYTVSGVMDNFPTNSHIQCDFLLTLTRPCILARREQTQLGRKQLLTPISG